MKYLDALAFGFSLPAIAIWFANRQHRTPDQVEIDRLAKRDRRRWG